MGKKGRILLGVLLAFALGGFVWRLMPANEPLYGERPLRVWIQVLNDTSPGFDLPSVWQSLGQDQLAVLTNALEIRGKRFSSIYARVHNVIWPIWPAAILGPMPMPLYTQEIAINAIEQLDRMGMEARPAIPSLIHIMETDRSNALREMAARSLEKLGAENAAVTAAFISGLKDKDPFMKTLSASALKSLDPEAAAKEGVK